MLGKLILPQKSDLSTEQKSIQTKLLLFIRRKYVFQFMWKGEELRKIAFISEKNDHLRVNQIQLRFLAF